MHRHERLDSSRCASEGETEKRKEAAIRISKNRLLDGIKVAWREGFEPPGHC